MLCRLDLPEFLQADAVFLRLAAVSEAELRDQVLGQRAPRALGEQRIFAQQLHAARGSPGFVLAVALDAHVAGDDAGDGAGIVERISAAAKPG